MNYFKINIPQGQRLSEALQMPDRIDREIEVLTILTDKDRDYYECLPEWKLEEAIKKTGWLSELPEPKQAQPFIHGNSIYKFKTSPRQLSKWEFVMLQDLSQRNLVDNLHAIMAVLSVRTRIFPQKEIEQTPEEFERRSKLFHDKLPFGTAYAYALFFSAYWPSYLNFTQAYLKGVEKALSETLDLNGHASPTNSQAVG